MPRTSWFLALLLLAACERRPRDAAPRVDPKVRPAPRPDAGARPRDAGPPARDAGPPARDAGPVGASNRPATEEIAAAQVMKKGWYRCHVYDRHVVLVSGPEDSDQSFAVKPRGPDLEQACQWKGPFLLARESSGDVRITFTGMFRDRVVYVENPGEGASLRVHDLSTRKERIAHRYYRADDSPTYEGNGRFTWWDPVGRVDSGNPYVDGGKQCNEALRRALVKLKAEHAPLYDALAPEPCWKAWSFDYGHRDTPSCDRFAWWGRFELDLRNPRPRRLPELRCQWMSGL